ncbi:unnamed protein product, partial [Owenia fusiformis]
NELFKMNALVHFFFSAVFGSSVIVSDAATCKGEFLLTRLPYSSYVPRAVPQCQQYFRFTSLYEEQCFSETNGVDANWLYFRPNNDCRIGICDSNINNTDWDYKWYESSSYTGKTYVKPHPYTPRCHNSYFMRRTWKNNVKSQCPLIRTWTGQDLRECMTLACEDKANVFNFYPDETPLRCETKHCKWTSSAKDYNFLFASSTAVSVYALEHTKLSGPNSEHWLETEIPHPEGCYSRGQIDLTSNKDLDYCSTGSNMIKQTSSNATKSLYTCPQNHEGTAWLTTYAGNRACVTKSSTRWLMSPYPGTPNCNSSIFVIKQLRSQCLKSSCDRSIIIHEAKDLRQCMLYACDHGAPVINYYSYSTTVTCDLRFCDRLPNGDLELKYTTTGTYTGSSFDVYVLQHDPNRDIPVSSTTPLVSTADTYSASPSLSTMASTFEPPIETSKAPSTIATSDTSATSSQKLQQYEQENYILRLAMIALGIALAIAIGVIVTVCIMLRRRPKKQADQLAKTIENDGVDMTSVDAACENPVQNGNPANATNTYEKLGANGNAADDSQYGNSEFLRKKGLA